MEFSLTLGSTTAIAVWSAAELLYERTPGRSNDVHPVPVYLYCKLVFAVILMLFNVSLRRFRPKYTLVQQCRELVCLRYQSP